MVPSAYDCYSDPAFHTRFLDNKSDIENVRKCFAGLWSFENDNIVNSAIESQELFVLKPQREGGGITSISLRGQNVGH